MKYLIASLILVSSLGINAQNNTSVDQAKTVVIPQLNQVKYIPSNGHLGFTMNVTGLINNLGLSSYKDAGGTDLILGKYYASDRSVYRVGFGINATSFNTNSTDSLGSSQVNYDSTFSRASVYISPGYEYHFLGDKRLDPYVGGAITLGLIGSSRYNTTAEVVDTTGNNKTEVTYQQDGGFVFGATAIVGFNYFVARNFSLGAEYQLGVLHNRVGGDWERVTVNTPVSGNSNSIRQIGANRSAMTNVGLSSQLNITLSYFLNIQN